mmetsp:Transcript_20211/g.26707  ORF Transcript_20211/g.26707 Transcript_20211/m.26707 type:complete len:394 (-) Transcript_20211:139-1320(-)
MELAAWKETPSLPYQYQTCNKHEYVIENSTKSPVYIVDISILPERGSIKETNESHLMPKSNEIVSGLLGDSRCDSAYLKATGLIALCTFFSASYYPSIRALFTIVDTPPPLLAWNAGVAVLSCIFSLIYRHFGMMETSPISKRDIFAGFELGFWSFAGLTLNNIGLALTTAAQAALFTQTTTVIVPLMQGIIGVPIPPKVWVGCILACVGALLLVLDSKSLSNTLDLHLVVRGDGICVIAALFYSLFYLRVNILGSHHDLVNLAHTRIISYAFFSTVAAMFPLVECGSYIQEFKKFREQVAIKSAIIMFCVMIWHGFFIQFLGIILFVLGQNVIGPSRTVIIFSAIPMIAAIIGWICLGEKMGFLGMSGSIVFLLSFLIAIIHFPRKFNCCVG